MADSLDELHALAARLGLKRAWFQSKPGGAAHYDVTDTMRLKALQQGAVGLTRPTDNDTLKTVIRQARAQLRQPAGVAARLTRDNPMDLTKLPPAARSAAMRGGTKNWGTHGSSTEHVRYALPVRPTSRKRCSCGCNRRATHRGMANGVCLFRGCELSVRRWIKTG